MFDRYSESARRVLVLTTEESRLLGHGYVGTEHLLAAIAQHNGRAAAVLAHFGLTPKTIREAIIERVGRGLGDRTGHLPFTESAKAALALAAQETVALRDHDIDDTHLLLGLLSMDSGVGLSIARAAVASVSEIRETLLKDMAITRAESAQDSDPYTDPKFLALLDTLAAAGAGEDATDAQRAASRLARQLLDRLPGRTQ